MKFGSRREFKITMRFFHWPVKLRPGDQRGSCASSWTCIRLGLLGERTARDIDGAHTPHSGGLGGCPASIGSPGTHLPARTGRSRSAIDNSGRRWPNQHEFPLLPSRSLAPYQTDICSALDRSSRDRGHENQSLRYRTNRDATKRSAKVGRSHAIPVSLHPHCNPGWPGLSELNHLFWRTRRDRPTNSIRAPFALDSQYRATLR